MRLFQRDGVKQNLGIGKTIEFEAELIKKAIPELLTNIKKGEEFVAKNPPAL